MSISNLIPIAAAHEFIGLRKSAVYDLIKGGQLQAEKIGSKTFITETEIARFRARERPQSAARTRRAKPSRRPDTVTPSDGNRKASFDRPFSEKLMSYQSEPARTSDRQKIELHRLDKLPQRPPRREIVRGLFAAGEVIAIAGPPGCGKSAVAVALVNAVATGHNFFGRPVPQRSGGLHRRGAVR